MDPMKIKFNEAVWHDRPYIHPQLRVQVAKDFYGREEEKRRAERVLKDLLTRRPVIVWGERRGGKTSFLRLISACLANDASEQFVPVSVPWQGIHSRDALLEEILQSICFELDIGLSEIDALPSALNRSELTTSQIINLLRRLLRLAEGKTVIICIDEFDSIIEEELTPLVEKDKILGLTNALVEGLDDLPVKLLLTMTCSLGEEGLRSSPLIAEAEQINLHPFSKAEMDEMVLDLLGPDGLPSLGDLERIYELSGGWPYYTKLLLVHLAELPPGDKWLDRGLARAVHDPNARQTLENVYRMHFDPSEKAMVLLLAKRDGNVKAEEMEVASTSLRTAAEQLAARDYVIRGEDGSCRFRIGFLREWFSEWIKFEEQVEEYLTMFEG